MYKLKMKFRNICLMVFLLSLSINHASAVSLQDRALSEIRINHVDQQLVIQVGFNFPVRYLRHYPLGPGKELNIQLEPIISDIEGLTGLQGREVLSAADNNPAGLVRVEYEGNELGKPTIRVVFDKAVDYEAEQGDDFRSLVIRIPAKQEVETEIKAGGTDLSIDLLQEPGMFALQRQQELLEEGAKATAEGDYMRAILIYTELLDAADDQVREFAQFQLAEAQEKKGHLAHARAEYNNYLDAYPEGENAEQARARLKALSSEELSGEVPGEAEGWIHDYFGSVSVYYDRDESMYDDGEDIENISSLITGFDATVRSRSDKFTAKTVVIGSYELSFLDNRDNRTRVNRLYFDFQDTTETVDGRLGRQSASKGGVLTRFDGGQIGYRFMEKVRINLVAGFPVNLPYDGLETDRYFYGINFDLGRFAGHWDINTYVINQVSDSIDDRRAVGGEVRYIAEKGSLYSLLDYDILFDELSVFLLTGNYLLPNDKSRINILADFRGVPILSSNNALIGQLSPSLETLEDVIGEDELRRLARDRTLDSSFASLGISHPITDNIQIAGDISWSKIDSAPASGGVEAFESTGDEYYYFLQFIGSGMIKENDISSVGFRYADTGYRDTYTFTINSRYQFFNNFRISPKLQIDYRDNKIQPGDQWRIIPGLRLEYTLAKNWRFEIEGEYRYADQELEGVADGKDGYTVSIGVRWDF